MSDALSSIISTLGSLAAGGFALGGVWLNNKLQKPDRDRERQSQRNLVLRARAEDAYTEVQALLDEVTRTATTARAKTIGAEVDAKIDLWPSFARLRTLLAVYFPEGLGVLRKYETDRLAALQPLIEEMKGITEAKAHNEIVSRAADVLAIRTAAMAGELKLFLDAEALKLRD